VLDLATILVRFALYASVLGLAGIAAFNLYAPFAAALLPHRRAAAWLAAVALVASLANLWSVAVAMGGSVAAGLDPTILWMVASGTPPGMGAVVRIAALAVALLVLASSRPGPRLDRRLLVPALVAMASLAWGGHAVTDTGLKAKAHLAVDILHLAAASVWLGALAAFVRLARQGRPDGPVLHRALRQFSGVGSAVVAVLILTGLANGLLVVGGWKGVAMATGTLWEQLLIVKLALFAGMLGLAWSHRTRLTPRLGRDLADPAAWRALRLSLAVELALGIVIVAMVAWLGTLSPMHDM
jgi:putative copper resistance protein D